MIKKFRGEGMGCLGCKKAVEKTLKEVSGVDNIIVDDLIMALDNGINEIHNTREDRD